MGPEQSARAHQGTGWCGWHSLGTRAPCAGSPSPRGSLPTGRSSGQPAVPSSPGLTELLGHGAQVTQGCPPRPSLESCLGRPTGKQAGSRECRSTMGGQRAPRPQGPALRADASGFSAPDISVIQRSWAGIFENGLSLKASKEKQHPEGAHIAELRLMNTDDCGRIAYLWAQRAKMLRWSLQPC